MYRWDKLSSGGSGREVVADNIQVSDTIHSCRDLVFRGEQLISEGNGTCSRSPRTAGSILDLLTPSKLPSWPRRGISSNVLFPSSRRIPCRCHSRLLRYARVRVAVRLTSPTTSNGWSSPRTVASKFSEGLALGASGIGMAEFRKIAMVTPLHGSGRNKPSRGEGKSAVGRHIWDRAVQGN